MPAISAHFIFESLAYAVGFALYARLRRTTGDVIQDSQRGSIIAAAIVGAAIGSKLIEWASYPAEFAAQWRSLQFLMGGKTIVGGLLGGTVAVEWVKMRQGIRSRTGDLFAVPLAVGIAIGRVGCFLAGLADRTYGIASRLPWAVDFGDGVRRHPVQIYESLFLLGLAAALRQMQSRPHRTGAVFRAFLVAYLAFRLLIDFLKPDPKFAGLSVLQWTCAAALSWYLRDTAALLKHPRQEAAHG